MWNFATIPTFNCYNANTETKLKIKSTMADINYEPSFDSPETKYYLISTTKNMHELSNELPKD